MSKVPIMIALAALLALAAACGGDDEPAASPEGGGVRTIEISALDELRFEPADIEVAVGETIRFVVTNDGAIPHDFLIGDEASQMQHEEEMQAGMGHEEMEGEMEGEHMGFPEAFVLDPGASEEIEVTFDEAGTFLYGCHQPGHYDAGMVGTITVA